MSFIGTNTVFSKAYNILSRLCITKRNKLYTNQSFVSYGKNESCSNR